ncbi:hypothetical protein CLOM_g8587, partial [Closterium sp. NIES-68]
LTAVPPSLHLHPLLPTTHSHPGTPTPPSSFPLPAAGTRTRLTDCPFGSAAAAGAGAAAGAAGAAVTAKAEVWASWLFAKVPLPGPPSWYRDSPHWPSLLPDCCCWAAAAGAGAVKAECGAGWLLPRSPFPLLLAGSSTRLTGSSFQTAAAGLPLGRNAAGAAAAAGGFKAEPGAG